MSVKNIIIKMLYFFSIRFCCDISTILKVVKISLYVFILPLIPVDGHQGNIWVKQFFRLLCEVLHTMINEHHDDPSEIVNAVAGVVSVLCLVMLVICEERWTFVQSDFQYKGESESNDVMVADQELINVTASQPTTF